MNAVPTWTTLVSPSDLVAQLGHPMLVVLDARFSLADPAAGEAAWREAHIPGAHYVHLDRDLSGERAPGAGRHPWPTADGFARTLAALGITPAHQVVAHDAGDGAFAARAGACCAWRGTRGGGPGRRPAGLESEGLPLDDASRTSRPRRPIRGRSTSAGFSMRGVWRRTWPRAGCCSMPARGTASAARSSPSTRVPAMSRARPRGRMRTISPTGASSRPGSWPPSSRSCLAGANRLPRWRCAVRA